MAARGRHAGRHNVGIVEDGNRDATEERFERFGQDGFYVNALELDQVGRVLHNTVADDAWHSDANMSRRIRESKALQL